ncbi:MAG: flagellar motor protein MotB [Rhodobiaceae bacterium]|nr:flagellar motor protein MotB [Rhodobiaceae bacterium]
MARKDRGGGGGGGVPEWLVTFADLMSILVCFFVLIISFSIQDSEKLQVVAGSMKDAFGIREESRRAGFIELEGAPVRDFVKKLSAVDEENDSDYAEIRHDQRRKQGPEANTHDIEENDIERPREFSTAAASLRQAWQEMPEITELSSQIVLEDTSEGLNIQLIDQEGRSMFPEGSKYPYERTRQLLLKMAPALHAMPNRIAITGHTNAERGGSTSADLWELSAQRANAVRAILEDAGIPKERIFSVVGKADSEPLFPDDPFLSANRRVEILLMAEQPPISADYKL